MNMKLTAPVFNDIAETLHFIHSKGFLHNDLKTDNVLIDRGDGDQFRPVIIDFGKSKETRSVVGFKRAAQIEYIAPQVKLGEPESPASDIFSFGKMLELAVSKASFCCKFSDLVSKITSSVASQRISANVVSLLLLEKNSIT